MIHIKGFLPFWSGEMIDWSATDALLSVNQPQKADMPLSFNDPWEEAGTNFFTVLKDGDLYRMYYLVWGLNGSVFEDGISVCYAESRDGLKWEKPDLGLCDFRGSKHNNLVLTHLDDNFSVMIDQNPACPPDQRYKALVATRTPTDIHDITDTGEFYLVALTSADGLHFHYHGVISAGYRYDSLNSLHWNAQKGEYVCFFRETHDAPDHSECPFNETRIRGIYKTESKDFVNWSDPVPLDFCGGEDYPLYTNCISAYPPDPGYFVGFPTRYVERRAWTPNYERLCGRESRLKRMKENPRYGLAVTDCVFMSSADLLHWNRFDEAFITPGPEREGSWEYGSCFVGLGSPLETPSRFAGEPPELSIYLMEHAWKARSKLVRYTCRRDGFASVKGGYQLRKLRTKLFVPDGDALTLNFRTSARGSLYLRILDEHNSSITGYATCALFGDALDRPVDFEKPFSALRGQPIKLEFTLCDAELFALHIL